ncbi:Ldh family oxidoreductase [Propionivibrio dicarboxylicus]|uniref:Ureidoglycolate dehydrogenase (NAD+) n=1 Tax=Propionivibrio dicarboxylicus TaxID=83767 RepID=A0A1G8D206_9RHOO|nr:Ldh family oxidoreductase [Propionivibrio dicarboxylicus]SDH51722.1 ureidoglycolate dehydrogenase (NAD+) [Propionivibrio dicarboxylicus]
MIQPVVPGSVRVPGASVIAWAVSCLEALDMDVADARLLAESLVQTSLWGIDSHGIARLPHYMERLSRGSIKARPNIVVNTTGASTAQVHGDQGQGIIVGHRAARLATQMAKETGIAAVGVSDSSHCGAMALYSRPAAKEGLIALAFTHSDSMAAPFGGTRAFFGTNPISIAIPRAGHEPTCLDMATTSIPFNRVVNARREGHPLPDGVAYDEAGEITTDAGATRSLLPLGGPEFGYKGYGLALMIDLLCGPLNGNPYGPTISGMFAEMDTPRRLGAFFLMIDPIRFAGGSTLATTVDTMADALAREPGSPKMPGDPELAEEANRLRAGIPIEPVLAEQMREWTTRLQLNTLPSELRRIG